MELNLSHTLHLFNIFREFDGKENCAQVLEGECFKMLGTKSLNDEHACNVFSMNSLKSMVLMMIALVMMKMSLISMSIFLECIEFASTHQLGKIDFARNISIWKLNGCKRD